MKAWIIVAALVLAGCDLPPAAVSGPTTPLATAPLPPPPPPAKRIDHDGTYKVGRDIAAGVWHTDGPMRHINQYDQNGNPIPVASCHWATGQLGAQSGAPIVYGDKDTRATGDESGPRDVTVTLANDEFTTIGCKPWKLRS